MLQLYMDYRKNAEKKANYQPTRIIFYRGTEIPGCAPSLSLMIPVDGVSEGQFKHVIEQGKFIYWLERDRLAHPVRPAKNSRSSRVSAIY